MARALAAGAAARARRARRRALRRCARPGASRRAQPLVRGRGRRGRRGRRAAARRATGATPAEAAVAHVCFRFFDGDMHYSEPALNVLVRALQGATVTQRERFFAATVATRRRLERAWRSTPLAKAFTCADEYRALAQRAQAVFVREALRARGLTPWEGFVAMDADDNGVLSPAEVYGGLAWLGAPGTTPDDVIDFVEAGDKTRDGNLDYREYLELLRVDGDDDDDAAAAAAPPAAPAAAAAARTRRRRRDRRRRARAPAAAAQGRAARRRRAARGRRAQAARGDRRASRERARLAARAERLDRRVYERLAESPRAGAAGVNPRVDVL